MDMRTLRRIMFLSVLGLATASTGCNTVKGVGKDLQRAGQKIEDAAKN